MCEIYLLGYVINKIKNEIDRIQVPTDKYSIFLQKRMYDWGVK